MKILLKFDQTSEYKRPAAAYPLHDFHAFCRICTSFQVSQLLKMDGFAKGVMALYGLQVEGVVFPQIFSVPWRRNYASTSPPKF